MVQKSTAPVDSFIFKSPEITGFCPEIYRLAWLASIFIPQPFPRHHYQVYLATSAEGMERQAARSRHVDWDLWNFGEDNSPSKQ